MSTASQPVEIVVYTRALCIWCWKVKRLLRMNGLSFEERPARDEGVRAQLLARTGRRTVPQVFVNNETIGGFEDTRAWLARGGLRPPRDAV